MAHDEVAHDDDGDDSDGSEGFEVVAPLVDDSTCGTSDAPSESAPPECTLPPPPEAGLLALPLPPPAVWRQLEWRWLGAARDWP